MAVVPWAQPFPTGWSQSTDSGASYAPPDAPASSPEVVGPTGTQRFRVQFTIPANIGGTYFVTVSGDTYDTSVNDPAHLYYDGVDQGAVSPIAGPRTYTLPAVPGFHTLELWIGASDSVAGITAPVVTFDYVNTVNTSNVPCDCCPTVGPTTCGLVQIRFSGVSETASQAGWVATNLPLTIDGTTTSAALSGYNSPAGVGPSTTLQVTYTNVVPQNRVKGLRIWGQGGGDLNDADGPATFQADFYAGATLLATLPCSSVNGAAPWTNLFGPGIELNGVDRVVMRSILKLSGSTISPLWRELQLIERQILFPCRRASGVLEWYDESGNLVPQADLASCGVGQPLTLPALHMAGSFFDLHPTFAEDMCNVVPAPSATSGWTAAGACYQPVTASPTLDWTNVSSVELEYGAGNAGGALVQFSSATTGNINFPLNGGSMAVGESRLSLPLLNNYRAVLTYVSGPPQTSPAGTIRTEGGNTLGLHRFNISSVAPIRFRLAFFTNVP